LEAVLGQRQTVIRELEALVWDDGRATRALRQRLKLLADEQAQLLAELDALVGVSAESALR
jgi:hypothetical protein